MWLNNQKEDIAMKQTYIQPLTEVVGVVMGSMIAASPVEESYRNIGGGPTEDGGLTLPTAVGETDGEVDPYSSRGQGSGGSGNRSKGGGMWDLWDD